MTCQELVEAVTEYLEGTMPGPERLRFEVHLETCDGCQRHIRQMHATLEASGRIAEESLSEEATRQLLEAFRNWKR